MLILSLFFIAVSTLFLRFVLLFIFCLLLVRAVKQLFAYTVILPGCLALAFVFWYLLHINFAKQGGKTMAFGLFSGRKETADIIYTNCTIHTMDAAMPLADAVACRDGIIMRVGSDEDMQDIVGDETEVFDLEGMHVFPGFIEADATPVLDAIDEDVCYVIDEDESIEEILSGLSDHISEYFTDVTIDLEDADDADDAVSEEEFDGGFDEEFDGFDEETMLIPDVVFGYGFDSSLLSDMELEERQSLLDEVCDDSPVLLLSEDGLTAWFNTIAFDIVAAAAEENGMEILTLPFMLSVLAPVDAERFEASAFEVMRGYCSEGFTSVFEGSAGAYISSIFEDLQIALLAEENIKLRFINGIYICSEVNPSYIESQLKNHKAKYQEMGGILTGGIVCAHERGGNLSVQFLSEMMKAAASRGGRVLLEAESPEDIALCRSAISSYRERSGGKPDIVLSHDGELQHSDTHFEYALMPEGETPYDEIVIRTTAAAEKLGLSDILGSVSEGKYADFAIFESDPLEADSVADDNAAMTIIGGRIVYDCDEKFLTM